MSAARGCGAGGDTPRLGGWGGERGWPRRAESGQADVVLERVKCACWYTTRPWRHESLVGVGRSLPDL